MKPHIYRILYGTRQIWVCHYKGSELAGWGPSPTVAYQQWKKSEDEKQALVQALKRSFIVDGVETRQ